MTERIRLEVDDAELEAVIARLDEAILKKAELLEIPRVAEGVTRAPVIAEGDMQAVIDNLESQLDDVQAEALFVETLNEAVIDKITGKIIAAEEAVKVTEVFADLTLQRIMAELSGVQTHVQTVRKLIELDLEGIRVEGEAAEAKIRQVQAFAKDLPQVDRATRMILLKVPGLREVLRLLYVIKMEERTLRLGGVRGPITAVITTILYMGMLFKTLQRRQNGIEARMEMLEQRAEQRFITIEEAVRGYGDLPERYRVTVSP